MSPMKKVMISVAVLTAIIVGGIGAASAARLYLGSTEQDGAVRVCGDRRGIVHRMVIENRSVRPESVAARLCDTLVIENRDDARRRLAFGGHDHHIDYDGAEGKLVGQGEMLTLVLAEAGDFMFHDHFDEQVNGRFAVAE